MLIFVFIYWMWFYPDFCITLSTSCWLCPSAFLLCASFKPDPGFLQVLSALPAPWCWDGANSSLFLSLSAPWAAPWVVLKRWGLSWKPAMPALGTSDSAGAVQVWYWISLRSGSRSVPLVILSKLILFPIFLHKNTHISFCGYPKYPVLIFPQL